MGHFEKGRWIEEPCESFDEWLKRMVLTNPIKLEPVPVSSLPQPLPTQSESQWIEPPKDIVDDMIKARDKIKAGNEKFIAEHKFNPNKPILLMPSVNGYDLFEININLKRDYWRDVVSVWEK